MPDAAGTSPTPGGLVPAAAESPRAGKPGRIRLSKALAAMAKAKSKEMEAAQQQWVARRCKLTPEEEVILAALKLRLQTLGFDLRKGDLLRAGLLTLISFDDARLQEAIGKLESRSNEAARRGTA